MRSFWPAVMTVSDLYIFIEDSRQRAKLQSQIKVEEKARYRSQGESMSPRLQQAQKVQTTRRTAADWSTRHSANFGGTRKMCSRRGTKMRSRGSRAATRS